MKIEKLTRQQIELFAAYVKKWTDVGLCTAPINFERAKAAILEVYRCGGIAPPKEIVYCASPIEAQRKINKYTGTAKMKYISSTLEGQHNAGIVAFYKFFQEACGLVQETAKMEGIFQATQECGWMYLYKTIAFVCDRPNTLYRDGMARLHNNDTAALTYPDGYSIYAWHGTRVPEYVIVHPEKITVDDIMNEKNQEIRRVKIIKFGIDNLVNSNEVILIDEDPEFGALFHTRTFRDIDKNPFAFLKVINASVEIENKETAEIVKNEKIIKYYEYLLAKNEKLEKSENEEFLKLKARKEELFEIAKPIKETYALRINPHIHSARSAWQSTFKKIKDFNPIIQT